MSDAPLKVLLVDDERLARAELRRLLKVHPEVEIVAEAADAEAARAAIARHAPELVFLDVQMPGENGFELLASLDAAPPVIFTTAYDEYALRAFEVDALDYLVKPVEPKRLARAVRRASERSTPPEVLSAEHQVFVKDGDRCWFVRLGEVRLFEAEGNYVRLYFGHPQQPLVGRSLAQLEVRLDPSAFFRASRKHLVGLHWIQSVRSSPSGGLRMRLDGAPEVEVSRRQARALRERMSL